MTLYEAQKGGSYCIEGLYVEPAITRRLQALGLNDGTVINVLNRKNKGALIIQVRGTRLALGKHISSSIEISEAADGIAPETEWTSKKGIATETERISKDGIAPETERISKDSIESKTARTSGGNILQQDGQEFGAKGEEEAVKQ
ncbi:MAG TPA: hypothetical protein DCZ91_14305 [Lachnospiraceae bacterium]|nr:hypothetical protein [Lachnospiraceae bacterium]